MQNNKSYFTADYTVGENYIEMRLGNTPSNNARIKSNTGQANCGTNIAQPHFVSHFTQMLKEMISSLWS